LSGKTRTQERSRMQEASSFETVCISVLTPDVLQLCAMLRNGL
jgi:hypothetical protein